MATNARAGFARFEVHETPHSLHLHVVLVQCLKEEVLPCWYDEMGGTVFMHGDDAMVHFDKDVRRQADDRVLAKRLVVGPESLDTSAIED